jgi:hypothetical protein
MFTFLSILLTNMLSIWFPNYNMKREMKIHQLGNPKS